MTSLESVADEQHQDLTLFVQNLLKEMQTRFQSMSDGIVNRIDDMGNRIDDLERSINDLMQEVGMEEGKCGFDSVGMAPPVQQSQQ